MPATHLHNFSFAFSTHITLDIILIYLHTRVGSNFQIQLFEQFIREARDDV